MPSHSHITNIPTCDSATYIGSQSFQRSAVTTGTYRSVSSSTGGDGSHNNLQPYYVTYIWKRIA